LSNQRVRSGRYEQAGIPSGIFFHGYDIFTLQTTELSRRFHPCHDIAFSKKTVKTFISFLCLCAALEKILIMEKIRPVRSEIFLRIVKARRIGLFFSQRSFWATVRNLSAPAAVTSPPGAITQEKVILHNRAAQGRFGGTGTVPSERLC